MSSQMRTVRVFTSSFRRNSALATETKYNPWYHPHPYIQGGGAVIDETILFEMLVAIATAVIYPSAVSAESITLQQGVEGYAGCTTKTLWGEEVKDKAGVPGCLYMRGARNRLLVRFDIPKDFADKTLGHVRLCLFLPEARNANIYTEMFCHEVFDDGSMFAIDEETDYDKGRRPGAVDSVELFAPPGHNWKHFPYLPLGIPEGGKWIEFNITRLVEKWLKNPAVNHGVMLIPTNCPDERFPSTWAIDIPSASGNTEHRPKLVLEFAPPQQEYLVGMTHGLQRICDRSTRYEYRGGYGAEYKMSMAQNEFEGFQVVIYPILNDLRNVRFTWTDLTNDAGDKIPASDVECFIEDWYQLRRNWLTRDVFFGGKLYETVDPLIPAKPITIKRHVHTPFFFRVRTRPETPAGNYRGAITVHFDNAKSVGAKTVGETPVLPTVAPPLCLEVKVWPYAIPEKWNFHTMGQFVWDNARRFHAEDFNGMLARKYYDFLLAHRFSPTEQYTRRLSPRTLLDYCLKRGMNTVYLSGNFTGSDDELAQLKEDYETVKNLGALDHVLVYIGDETDNWDEMRRRANLIHANLPGVMVMIGGSLPHKELLGYIDIFDPIIGGNSKFWSLQEDNTHLVRQSQQRGEEFYWYVACGPSYPYPNVQVEYPLIASRVLFWMTWKYSVTGFEYYCYNIWERNYSSDPAKRYPNVKWNADGWSSGWPTNGDGMLFYPGPISSLRFEAIRDGIEDWESHLVLRDCIEAVKHRKDASKYRALIDKAERLLKVDDDIAADFTHYTMDPERLMAEREELGDLIAQFADIIPETQKWDAGAYTYDKAVEVRIARQTTLRRNMLRERHSLACQALKVEPLSQEAWDVLWPKRVLFEQDFEGDDDWNGNITTDNVPDNSQRALAGDTANRYFARFIRVGIRFDHARAATTTWIKFRYYANQETPLEVMLFDLTQGDNYAARLDKPVVGKWTEVTMKVTREFRRKDGSSASMAAGDAIDDIFFGAGKPGDKDCQLLVDNVVLLGLD